jgi:hypothetical protein
LHEDSRNRHRRRDADDARDEPFGLVFRSRLTVGRTLGGSLRDCHASNDARPDARRQVRGRSAGKRTTSRIVSRPVSTIASRSIPTPSPPVGGMPYESAST